ncbi:uncharacterized protein LOC134842588 isoform X2 [Symsagittifera roscoffensis]
MLAQNAIDAAYFEEVHLLDAKREKEERLNEFQKRLNERVVARKLKELREAEEVKAKEANAVAAIREKCRNVYSVKKPKATIIPNCNGHSKHENTTIQKRANQMSVKNARAKLHPSNAPVTDAEPSSIRVVECDRSFVAEKDGRPSPRVLDDVTQTEESSQNLVAHRNVYRKTMMAIERERAHERARLLELKKVKREKSKLIAATPGSENANSFLRLDLDSCDSEGEEASEPRPSTARSAHTYIVQSAEETHLLEKVPPSKQSVNQTNKEQERYSSALRRSAKELAESKRIHIPPLCPCSDSFWDHDPEKCAINCSFYRNRKLYDRAAQSFLRSYDIQAK